MLLARRPTFRLKGMEQCHFRICDGRQARFSRLDRNIALCLAASRWYVLLKRVFHNKVPGRATGQAQQRGTGRETTLPFEAKRICSGGRFSSFDSILDR